MTSTAAAAAARSDGPALSLLPVARLLVDGRVRVRGVWPGGADVDVTDGAQTWRVVERRGVWRCPCLVEGECVHVLAARLVVPVRGVS